MISVRSVAKEEPVVPKIQRVIRDTIVLIAMFFIVVAPIVAIVLGLCIGLGTGF